MSAPRFSISKITMAVTVNEKCLGWAAKDPSGFLYRCKFRRRSVGSDDVSISILYCGVCIADVVWTRNQLRNSDQSIVPGIVTEVGSNAGRFKVGDRVGVGTYVNSCRECVYCGDKLEVDCLKGAIHTFGCVDVDGTITKGGYSSYIVVHERYCFKIPESYPLKFAAPLLCYGITIYSPMMRHNMNQPGKSLGVIGVGGLGRMTVKFGKAFGLKVTVFCTSVSEREEALNILQADNFVVTSDKHQMMALNGSLDFIINTTTRNICFDLYLSLLKMAGVLVLLAFPGEAKIKLDHLTQSARTITGSIAGGTKHTQEMLNFCASYEIYPDVDLIPIQRVNKVLEMMPRRDLKHHFVIGIANFLN